MPGVGLSARFGKNNALYDGLKNLAEEIEKDPNQRYVVVAVVEPSFAKVDFKNGGEFIPTVRAVSIEPLFDDAANTARGLLAEAYRKRTGNDDDPAQATLFDVRSGDDDE